jgi:hypothetical protein
MSLLTTAGVYKYPQFKMLEHSTTCNLLDVPPRLLYGRTRSLPPLNRHLSTSSSAFHPFQEIVPIKSEFVFKTPNPDSPATHYHPTHYHLQQPPLPHLLSYHHHSIRPSSHHSSHCPITPPFASAAESPSVSPSPEASSSRDFVADSYVFRYTCRRNRIIDEGPGGGGGDRRRGPRLRGGARAVFCGCGCGAWLARAWMIGGFGWVGLLAL